MVSDQKTNGKSGLQYHIITLGCQMNKSDSERLESILLGLDMEKTENPEAADLIVMNSCSVRKSAEDRIHGLSQKFLEYKKTNPNLIVCITGCMPGRDRDGKMKSKLNGVDLYFPTKDMVYLPKWLSELNPNLRSMEHIEKDYLQLRPSYQKTFQAFVTIQTGCNHFCTYCVVPFSRGLERNRSVKDILDEVQTLANKGCLEITLLGQIVNHYIAPDPGHFSPSNPYSRNDFAKLLWEINRIPGIDRIHFTAPHPLYMDEEAIDALGLPKQVNYIHLPVQSGNNEILKKMNRRHDKEYYIQIVDSIRAKHPDVTIGTDIIVGFCGETEAMFEDTVSLYLRCDFDISYNAQYSPRSGTVSYKVFQDTVSKEEKKRRWWILQNLMEKRVFEKNQVYKGTELLVLVEQYDNGWCKGNSREMKRVHFQGQESDIGKVIPVFIERCEEWVLWGNKHKVLSG